MSDDETRPDLRSPDHHGATYADGPPDPFGPVVVVHVLDIRLLALAGVIGYLIGGIIFGSNHGR